MYRSLSLYPKSADEAAVADIVERSMAAFRASPGFIAAATSVDALMGPGAKGGEFGRVVTVDLASLDDALAVLQGEGFAEIQAASDLLDARHFLFECREI